MKTPDSHNDRASGGGRPQSVRAGRKPHAAPGEGAAAMSREAEREVVDRQAATIQRGTEAEAAGVVEEAARVRCRGDAVHRHLPPLEIDFHARSIGQLPQGHGVTPWNEQKPTSGGYHEKIRALREARSAPKLESVEEIWLG